MLISSLRNDVISVNGPYYTYDSLFDFAHLLYTNIDKNPEDWVFAGNTVLNLLNLC
jgi:hypothetical protein